MGAFPLSTGNPQTNNNTNPTPPMLQSQTDAMQSAMSTTNNNALSLEAQAEILYRQGESIPRIAALMTLDTQTVSEFLLNALDQAIQRALGPGAQNSNTTTQA